MKAVHNVLLIIVHPILLKKVLLKQVTRKQK